MTVFDSSVLIDYLDGDDTVVTYAEDHAREDIKTPHLALYEVYLGELYTAGEPDFAAIDDALSWVNVVNEQGPRFSRHAAQLMARLQDEGCTLAYRDGFIAASAWSLEERLVTRDSDFDTPEIRSEIDVDVI
jgi:hypothetical protein